MPTALHLHSAYSLLDGVPTPEQLAEQGAALGYSALALTDHNAVYGPSLARSCQAQSIQPIIGAELTIGGLIADRPAHLTLLAMNAVGYGNLCRLITQAHARRPDAQAGDAYSDEIMLDGQHLAEHTQALDGLICLSGCLDHGPVAQLVRARRFDQAAQMAQGLAELFPGRFYLELQRQYRRSDWRITASW
ncbi:MAG: PHP domain-containing protein [Anaerolineae bacterium]|nr:PHP domain-containing protein [Anaerolineae bacterium]